MSAAPAGNAAAGDQLAAAAAAAAAAADQEPGNEGVLLLQQLLLQDNSTESAHQQSSSIPTAVAADADTSGAAAESMQVLSTAASTLQQQLLQQQQQQLLPQSGASSSVDAGTYPTSDTQPAGAPPAGALQEEAVGGVVAESGAAGVMTPQPAAADALAEVEARLPSFAQRRLQQQQEEHAQADLPARTLQQRSAQGDLPAQQQQAADVAEQPKQFDQQVQQHLQVQSLPEVPNSQEQEQQQQPSSAPEIASSLAGHTTPAQLAALPPLPSISEQPMIAAAAAAQAAAGAAASTKPLEVQAAPEPSLPVPDPMRDFVLTLDVRSFQAGRRLPVALGSIYVTAWLPQELLGGPTGQGLHVHVVYALIAWCAL
jgi:hypothetical protein